MLNNINFFSSFFYLILLALIGIVWGGAGSNAFSALSSGNIKNFLFAVWATIPIFVVISLTLGFIINMIWGKFVKLYKFKK